MRELPSPTLPLLGLLDFPRRHEGPAATTVARPPHQPQLLPGAFEVVWARHLDEVRAAQRLRHAVFVEEMGARLPSLPGWPAGHDIDRFDDYCEHLLVRTLEGQGTQAEVIGTYRVLTPGAARRAGGYYSDTEFDLSALRGHREGMAELGRSCVHPAHRSGGVILALWGALASFMHANGLNAMMGCASIGMRDGGHQAASLWAQLQRSHLADPSLRAMPRLPLPVENLDQTLQVEAPALIKGYLRCGARVMGAPAWDPDFNTADLPMWMQMSDLPARYQRHFLCPETR